ncbi:type II and III secretion system protein family protein [Paragemmobacter straminiformis]|uniref:Type II and III secretion system protein family protein n=1 Tax=Paragemmobacter straminiformis TaxID=2045119 RepID=A0A842IDX2_9RHOB|nr:type II and III secretion system protein family protein [Gemmobacter straminiformis]MBC2837493.1 type II and III secretion system protein family protein [Gemmobacter straminiformis]
MKNTQGQKRLIPAAGLRGLGMLLAAVLMLGTVAPRAAMAQDSRFVTLGAKVDPIVVTPGFTLTVEVDKPYTDLVVGNPGVADVFPLTDRSLYIQGNAPGATNVALYDAQKKLIGSVIVQVRVDFNELQEAINRAVPSAGVEVSNVNNRVRLSGNVRDALDMQRVLEIAQQYSAADVPVVNAIRVVDPQQVQLDVRILEVNRNAGRALGVQLGNAGDDFTTPGPTGDIGTQISGVLRIAGGQVDVVINALEAKGLARRLANPQLVTSNGVEANFIVGGEVPITIAQPNEDGSGSTPTTTFRDVGVKLAFLPKVLDGGMISLRVQPEVSNIDEQFTGVDGQPGFSTRRADTTVSLMDGQSFAIAGLLQVDNTRSIDQTPWLGQVPILGALFRSTEFQKRETDLVILVTPHLVDPASPNQPLQSPLDNTRSSDDVELFLLGMMEVDRDTIKGFRTGEGIVGPYGHMIDLEFNDALINKK